MQAEPRARRRVPVALGAAVVAGAVALAATGAGPGSAATMRHHAPAKKAAQQRLHDGMRQLWEEHVAWTRLAIVEFADASPDLPATEARLLRNQVDIGNAIKPFYGRAAGNALTALLKTHITGAVAVLQAAKSGDQAALAKAKADWYVNGNDVADFLSRANRRNWPRAEMRAMMKTHLDQTLAEAVDLLTGRYDAGVAQYDAIEHHILGMADSLTHGIVKQFPRRFR